MINYQQENTKLEGFKPGESSKFWKPKPGQYRVRALTELEETDPFKKDGEPDKPQVKVGLLIGDEKVTWTMAKGVSPASSYGQLVNLAIKSNNKITNLDFMIVVTSDGKKNTYTIVKI